MNNAEALKERFRGKRARIGIMGLGYVGLPLAVEMVRSGYEVLGFEVRESVVEALNRGESHVQDVSSESIREAVRQGLFSATTSMEELSECDAISICVPTPLNKIKDPDLSYVAAASHAIAMQMRAGQLIILESTTYPGTTREVVLPILSESGLTLGEDFFLCFSPERVDPGNPVWHTRNTPKVLGGLTPECTRVGLSLYQEIFEQMVEVSSAEAAELTKVYENIFRMINIALANEMAQACDRLGVDVWEVVEAAATKPFGFMKFTPGPGLGGHCIPLDPHYLSWKMRTLSFRTRMIELASEINAEMPQFVVEKLADALNDMGKPVKGSRILVLGIAYKKNIDDLRESPSLEVMRLLQDKGGILTYHDPYCPVIEDDGHTPLKNLPWQSAALTEESLREADAVLIITDHSDVDYEMVVRESKLVLDTRGVLKDSGRKGGARIIGLSGTRQDG